MKRRETIGLDVLIQTTRAKAEGLEERGGGDRWRWIATPSLLPSLLQSRTMRRFPNLSPDAEGSLWRPLSSSLKLSQSVMLPLSFPASSVRSYLSEM